MVWTCGRRDREYTGGRMLPDKISGGRPERRFMDVVKGGSGGSWCERRIYREEKKKNLYHSIVLLR